MKLDSAVLPKVEEQLSIEALDDEDAVLPKLRETFGDHSFFLDAQGLNIVEPNPSGPDANVVRLASWTNAERNELRTHAPRKLTTTVKLGSSEPNAD